MANASPWSRRFARLKAMSGRELMDRLRQYGTARADVLSYRTGSNFSAAPRIEAAATCGRFYFTSADVPELIAALKQVLPGQARGIVEQAERVCRHRFDLLGYEDLDYGTEIDWHCDLVHGKQAPRKPWFKMRYLDFEEVGDSKITWELNRHQHFVTLAKAYWLTGDERFAGEVFAQWTHWHKQNPYPIGVNWASSLEVAFRTLSWIWTFFLLQECPRFSEELRAQWVAALRLNGRHIETYLSTYFSPNTHLLGEALALFSIGTLFPGIRSAARWRRCGWEVLETESATQVREDGFYFEQSTYYHVYALDMFLHARILAGLNGVQVSEQFDEILKRMLDALMFLGRAGLAPSFGDDDGGRLFDPRRNRAEHLLDPLATGSVLYRRGDFKFVAGSAREETLWLLGLKGLTEFEALQSSEPSGASTCLAGGGIYLLAEPESGQQLMIDAGPLGAGNGGHGHADALSITLVRSGRSLLIDPGTLEYVGPTGERARLRGTGAHNTMQIDARDQAEQTGPFSWQNPPRVNVEQWSTGHEFNLFQGSHDGYSSPSSPAIHRRWVFHRKGLFWLVRDLAVGSGAHQVDIAWHLGPTMVPASSDQIVFEDDRASLALLTPEQHGWSQSIRRDDWSPAYGRAQHASVVTFGAHVELPAEFATILMAGENVREDRGRLVKLNSFDPATLCVAYTYSKSQQEHNFFFATQAAPWTSGAWSSDAGFLYWFHDRKNGEHVLILCDGSYADAGGKRVLTCERRVGYAEVVASSAKVEVYSSDPDQVVLQRSLDQVQADGDLIVPGNDSKGMGV